MKRNITEANVRTITKEEFEHLRIDVDPICNNNINTVIEACYNRVRIAASLDPYGFFGRITKDVDFIFLDRCFYKNREHSNKYSSTYKTCKIYTDKVGYRKIMALAFSDHKTYVSWGYVPDDNETIIMDIIE